MDFEFSAEQELLRDSIRRFLDEQAPVRPYVRSMMDDPGSVTESVWKGLAEMGALALVAPEELGGTAPDLVTMGVVVEEAGRALLPGPLLASAVGAVTAITAAGAAEEHATLLTGIADGTRVGTLALYERTGRYALTSPETTASRDGETWRLDGTKTSVLNPAQADTFVVSAATDEGVGLFTVEADDLGADAIGDDTTIDLTRSTGSLSLNNTRAARVGADDATQALIRVGDVMAAMLAADGVGAAARVLDLAVEYAKERKQFDVPIGTFQAVQHLCADMLREVEITRAGTYYALWACQSAPADEAHRAATMAKAYASDALPRVGEAAIQIFGGIGFTWEHDVHLFYKRMLSAAVLFGNAGHHYDELASLVVD